MAGKKPLLPVGVTAGVVLLLAVAAVFLMHNFGELGLGTSWPVLPMALGLVLAVANYLELGLAFMGVFLLVLLANLGKIPHFSKSWPIALIVIALLLVVGWARGRAEKRKQGSS